MIRYFARRAAPPLIVTLLVLAACNGASGDAAALADTDPGRPANVPDTARSLVVAGGCFWCVESDFEGRDDVYEAVSGYAGGDKRNATYRNHSGHREVVRVWYDPDQATYGDLVSWFLRTIDVTDAGGQFCDRGHSYTTAIHYTTAAEKRAAKAAITEAAQALGRDVVTPVEPLPFFVRAEDYHQDYYKSEERIVGRFGYVTKAEAYKGYRKGCGRDARLREVWGDDARP